MILKPINVNRNGTSRVVSVLRHHIVYHYYVIALRVRIASSYCSSVLRHYIVYLYYVIVLRVRITSL
jgi:hypothetical protein